MGDLIRREELLTSQFVHTECYLQENKDRHYDVYKKGWNDALQAAHDNAPAVDAVEVVRCENCTYAETATGWLSSYLWCVKDFETGSGQKMAKQKDDFCSYGERKNDG